jgi:hypothetical protein
VRGIFARGTSGTLSVLYLNGGSRSRSALRFFGMRSWSSRMGPCSSLRDPSAAGSGADLPETRYGPDVTEGLRGPAPREVHHSPYPRSLWSANKRPTSVSSKRRSSSLSVSRKTRTSRYPRGGENADSIAGHGIHGKSQWEHLR